MQPVIELIKKTDASNPDPPTLLYACGECGRIHSPQIYVARDEGKHDAAHQSAEECCKPILCDCERPAMKHRTMCEGCIEDAERDKERAKFMKAKQFTVDDAPDDYVYYNDEHYSSVQDLCDTLESGAQMERDEFPLVVWLCDAQTPQLDAGRILEDFEENLELSDGTDFESACKDLDVLKTAITAFNAAQTPTLWYPSDTRCVVIEYRDVYPDEVTADPEQTPVCNVTPANLPTVPLSVSEIEEN